MALHDKTYGSSAGQRVLSCYNSYASQVWGRNIKCKIGPQGVPIWRTGPSKCKNEQFWKKNIFLVQIAVTLVFFNQSLWFYYQSIESLGSFKRSQTEKPNIPHTVMGTGRTCLKSTNHSVNFNWIKLKFAGSRAQTAYATWYPSTCTFEWWVPHPPVTGLKIEINWDL